MTTVSPELALVDAELAELAQASLYEPGGFRPAWPAEPERTLGRVPEPIEIAEPRRSQRRRSTRMVVAAGAAAALTTIALVTVSAVAGRRQDRVRPDAAAQRTEAQASARRDAADSHRYEWPAVPGVTAYRLVIARDGSAVYAVTTRKPSLVLPAQLKLGPGRYTWSATPASLDGKPVPGAEPVAEVTFLVSRPSA